MNVKGLILAGIVSTALSCQTLKKEEVSSITLEVKKSNISAIKLYEKCNFKSVSIRKKYYGNEDGILMFKEVGD